MQEYRVFIGGLEHTVLLSDEEAKARGLTPEKTRAAPEVKQAEAPRNKARTAETMSGDG